MQITDIILVTENDKGTEINFLTDLAEYMTSVGVELAQRPIGGAFHMFDLEQTKHDRGMWTEEYVAANKSFHERYCYNMEQLCSFLSGEYNEKGAEHYLDEERCSKGCLQVLEELGINKDGSFREGEEFARDYAVEIREILSRVETVKAASLGEAIEQVMDKYHREEIVLDADDFQEVIIEQEQQRGGR